MLALSSEQARILAYVQHYVATRGIAPTLRNIKAGCGIASLSGVFYSLDKLEEAGKITRQRRGKRRASRGIRLVAGEPETIAQLFRGYRCPEYPNEVEQRMADVIGDRAGALVFFPNGWTPLPTAPDTGPSATP